MHIGKRVFDELYVHLSALPYCEPLAGVASSLLNQLPALDLNGQTPNVLKYNLGTNRFSLLLYGEFESDPFPELVASWAFPADPLAGQPTLRRYDNSLNPPILHRKELLVAPDHPGREAWLALTQAAEAIGLFDDSSTIGFKLNWQRLIASKGYQLKGDQLMPLGNQAGPEQDTTPRTDSAQASGDPLVLRHLTALSRSAISAPVQLLLRHGLLRKEGSFFDYGCGRGGDVAALSAEGFAAQGWDPHFAAEQPKVEADVVNLGFVLNVIEDAAERAEALHKAFKLCRQVLAVGVMLYSPDVSGRPFKDGLLTSRNTFQKYFSQSELKEYIEHALNRPAFMAGPGIAYVFADQDLEQRFNAGRHRRLGMAERLLAAGRSVAMRRHAALARAPFQGPPRPSAKQAQLQQAQPLLDALWGLTLDLGRWPEAEEVSALRPELLPTLETQLGSFVVAKRLLSSDYDTAQLAEAARHRSDDLLLYLAAQQFSKRPAYRQLEARLQRDVKAFFGDYRNAQAAALRLMLDSAEPAKLYAACQQAAEQGLGWLEDQHSLQVHIDLVQRLPALLRAYVNCGLVLWDAVSEVQLVKIHIGSGKLTLMEFAGDEFDSSPLPRLKRRIKVNLRKLDYDVFDYGSAEYPMPLLYRKSRYLHEESAQYVEQLAFDQALEATGLLAESEFGPSAEALDKALELKRLGIQGMRLGRSERIPDLDQACGANFTYRSFIECGETQQRLGLRNIPLRPETYNALFDLATQVLDPAVSYFGSIRLTYGFSSPELGKHIHARVAPKLDQHASWERNKAGRLICERGGAACDLIVDDEDMKEVADWLLANTPLDRLYFYGTRSPVHVSFGPERGGRAVAMRLSDKGNLIPGRYS